MARIRSPPHPSRIRPIRDGVGTHNRTRRRGARDHQLAPVSLDDAQRIMAAGQVEAAEIESPSNIAVIDAGGNVVSHIRMDNAWVGSREKDQTVAEAAAAAF